MNEKVILLGKDSRVKKKKKKQIMINNIHINMYTQTQN